MGSSVGAVVRPSSKFNTNTHKNTQFAISQWMSKLNACIACAITYLIKQPLAFRERITKTNVNLGETEIFNIQ